MKDKTLLYPALDAIVGAFLMIITLFVPFASANDDYSERLMSYPDSVYSEEADMKNEDAVHISLIEFIKIDSAAIKTGLYEETAIANMVVIIAFALFSVLTLLFSVIKKPIAILIFNIISFAIMQFIRFDFEDRGVIPSSSYNWGIASIICYIGITISVIGAVLLLIAKIKSKRSIKASE
ncbi:hypothetical protein Osc1_09420 [Hominimerdicola sp. 21CYCFAH17_S]